MIKLAIQDVIGFGGVYNSQITESLKNITPGEDIEIEINSPGGSVFECISIFNTIREYAKSHPVSVFINGIAASAASVIALAARTVDAKAVVKVSENSLFFIHNPIDFVYGDYKKMQKIADYLQRLAAMFAGIYEGVSKQVLKKIQEAMDAETWYIGKEIQDAGFATDLEVINTTTESTPEARAALIANAEMTIAAAKKKASEAEAVDDIDKVAALIDTAMAIPGETPKNSGGSLPVETNQKPGENLSAGGMVGMTPQELMEKYPELYKAVFKLGMDAERERVAAHLRLAKEANAYEAAAKFITDGASVMTESVQAEYCALRMNNQHNQNRLADNPNPTNVADDGADDTKIMAAFEAGYLDKKTGGK